MKSNNKRTHLLWRYKNRVKVISHYSNDANCCECCGEKHIEFLAIDHRNGDGNKHRKKIGGLSGFMFHSWLIQNGLPDGFRVLCHNCNQSKGNLGGCPHNEATIYSEFK